MGSLDWRVLQGTLEADLTVTKIGPDDFMVVASDTAHRHVEAMMSRLAAGDVHITDVTGALAQINVQGPRSREILQQLTSHDLSNEVLRHAHQASQCTTAAHCMLDITLYCCTLHARHNSLLLHIACSALPFEFTPDCASPFDTPGVSISFSLKSPNGLCRASLRSDHIRGRVRL